jgi:hypothetical protein
VRRCIGAAEVRGGRSLLGDDASPCFARPDWTPIRTQGVTGSGYGLTSRMTRVSISNRLGHSWRSFGHRGGRLLVDVRDQSFDFRDAHAADVRRGHVDRVGLEPAERDAPRLIPAAHQMRDFVGVGVVFPEPGEPCRIRTFAELTRRRYQHPSGALLQRTRQGHIHADPARSPEARLARLAPSRCCPLRRMRRASRNGFAHSLSGWSTRRRRPASVR